MEYKIGDEVIWDKTPYIFDGHFVNDTERVWLRNIYTGASSVVLKSEIIPAPPSESRKELKKRIKELEQKLAKAEEAIEIVEALGGMPLGCGVWRTVVTNKWAYSMYRNGRDATEYYTTIKDALQAAGLMEKKEEQR